MRLLLIQVSLVSLTIALGCSGGDGINRVVVTGDVRLKGHPVEDGQIRFVPQTGTEGPITIEPICGGKYTCKRNGGVPVGQHRVEILAWDPKVPDPLGPGAKPRPQWAPPEFNIKSKLVESIEDNSASVVKDFDL